MNRSSIAIIGAGMAGLACARRLQDEGFQPVVFDKGRGVGGRLATRRTDTGLSFDHGAQYVTAKSDGFRSFLDALEHEGFACKWDTDDGSRIVGQPGMTGIAKGMAKGLDIRLGTRVTAIEETDYGWHLETGTEISHARHLVITAPPVQTTDLLGPEHALAQEIASVAIAPCWTLMAAFPADQPRPFKSRRDANDSLEWIAQNSTKPGRANHACWVAQASPQWSTAHLEKHPDEIGPQMLALLCERLGTDPAAAIHVAAHRWRYARVTSPLGRPFLRNTKGTLYLGGDWCLDARVEAAWASGTAIADDIIGAYQFADA